MMRSHTCGELRAGHEGQAVQLSGWVNRVRNLGGLGFLDLRDRHGMTQVVFEPEQPELMERAGRLHMESVIRVYGTVRRRPGAMANPEMATGEVEVVAAELELLSPADVLPFTLEAEDTAGEELRLKHRYLDLRRPHKAGFLLLRHRMAQTVRRALDGLGFLEIETPVLMKSTPEGARDYLVPSRIHPGCFYALPQSPQTYKQLLMVAGFDRYFQIVKCFRDEDLRSDRQPEFTQIDLELSFGDEADVQEAAEQVMAALFRELKGEELPLPLPRLTWREAMDRFGSDKPDLRIPLEIRPLDQLAGSSGFAVFQEAVQGGGVLRGLVFPGLAAAFSRKRIDGLQDYARHLGGQGVVVVRWTEEGLSSQIAKFTGEAWLEEMARAAGAAPGDLLILAAGEFRLVCKLLGNIRLRLAREEGLVDSSRHRLLWVTDFPMFEFDEEEQRLVAAHHPFTQPKREQLEAGVAPAELLSRGYDLVMDGQEIAGGSVRIHEREMQARVFTMLGISDEEAREKFGFLLEAFRYGTPPHAGCAFGFDRLVMIFGGTDNIRDVIAFPKTNRAASPMDGSPGRVDERQLVELHIALRGGSTAGDGGGEA
ncbi:MAG: aspartate--tRNA ligase [bacterium]|nr:aspartate--tRNA ligase [bacterium]